VVEAVGDDVTRFQIGDDVFGSAGMHLGAHAEYLCLPEKEAIALMPHTMSYEEAAAVPFGGRDALHFLRKGQLKRGQRILIIGAGGSIGTFAVQLAKHIGADVTAVDSGEKLEMLRSIGADDVVNYTAAEPACGQGTYDVIFDVVGRSPALRCLHALKQNGFYLLANPNFAQRLRGLWTATTTGRRVVTQAAEGSVGELDDLRELIEGGALVAVIDRRVPLEQMIAAHRYVETGRKQGNLVISVR